MKNNSKKIRGKNQDIATAQKVGTNTRTGKMLFMAYARSQALLSWKFALNVRFRSVLVQKISLEFLLKKSK